VHALTHFRTGNSHFLFRTTYSLNRCQSQALGPSLCGNVRPGVHIRTPTDSFGVFIRELFHNLEGQMDLSKQRKITNLLMGPGRTFRCNATVGRVHPGDSVNATL
jgi:hypothetical protein